MAIHYNDVVPWGRSLEEYERMFSLSDADLGKKILDCGGGPSSFNAQLTERGGSVVSADPVYAFSADDLARRIEETRDDVIAQTKANADCFVWDEIADPAALEKLRMGSMKRFLADYEQGKKGGRYINAELPALPFETDSFDLALSSHFLFLYTPNLTLEFHSRAIDEMLRVAKEVRIFPLVDVNADPSAYVDPIVEEKRGSGLNVQIEKVNYEFQRGGNMMMRISR